MTPFSEPGRRLESPRLCLQMAIALTEPPTDSPKSPPLLDGSQPPWPQTFSVEASSYFDASILRVLIKLKMF